VMAELELRCIQERQHASAMPMQIDTSCQLGVIYKFTEGAFSALIQVIIKILKRTGPSTNPWGTPLVTGHQLDLTPFITTLWVWPFSQFFTQQRVYLSELPASLGEYCRRQFQRLC